MVLRADQLLVTICCQNKGCANNYRLKLHTKLHWSMHTSAKLLQQTNHIKSSSTTGINHINSWEPTISGTNHATSSCYNQKTKTSTSPHTHAKCVAEHNSFQQNRTRKTNLVRKPYKKYDQEQFHQQQ